MADRSSGDRTDTQLVRALAAIVLAAIVSIAVITALVVMIDGAVIGDGSAAQVNSGDEVVSVLGQIGSAAVGALAGYFTARVVEHKYQAAPPAVDDDDD